MPASPSAYAQSSATSDVTSLSCQLPPNPVAGQLAVIICSADGATTTLSTNSTGWTKLGQLGGGSGTLATRLAVFYGVIGQAASPFVLLSSAAENLAVYSLLYNGADTSVAPLLSAVGTATSGQPDPPLLSGLDTAAPDYSILVFGATAYGATAYVPTTAPSGYAARIAQNGTTTLAGTSLFFSYRNGFSGVSSENPGAFSGASSTTTWVTATMAVRGAPAAPARKRGSFHHLVGAA